MTVKEAMRSIHKHRCGDMECIHCEYLCGLCDDPEITEIVEVLHLLPMTVTIEDVPKLGLRKVARPADGSGIIIYPENYKTKPEGDSATEYTTHLIDIGLLDED